MINNKFKYNLIITIHIVLFTALKKDTHAQCNCESIIKENVLTVACPPSPIATEHDTQIGLNVFKAYNQYQLGVTIRFKYSPKEIYGNITMVLEDGNSIELNYIDGGIVYLGNSQVAQAAFLISQNDLNKLKKSKLRIISFKLDDKMKRVYRITTSADLIIRHIKCLS